MSAVEYWDVYDAERRPTGRTIQRGMPLGEDDYVLVVNVFLRNRRGEWLLTQRTENKTQPLKWEPPGGHALSGETSLETALREMREETGIHLNAEDGELFTSLRRIRPSWENPGFVDLWVFPWDGEIADVVLQPGETRAARWASNAEVLRLIADGEFVPVEVHPYYRDLFARYPAPFHMRRLQKGEEALLRHCLYKAIFVPEGSEPPAEDICDKPELRVYTDGFGARPHDRGIVAEQDGHPVGAVWTRIMDDYGHVDDETPSLAISLDEAARGQGIGTALLRAMLDQLRADGCKQVSLSVQKANYALRMYRSAGFVPIRETEEEYIMLCPLSSGTSVPRPT